MSTTKQLFPASEAMRSLREQIIAGDCVLFAGPGISAGTTKHARLPNRAELTESLLASLGRDKEALSPGDASFPWAAQCYEIEQGRASLVSFLEEKMQVVQEPLPVQRAIADLLFPLVSIINALPFPLILTTNHDVSLERALDEKGMAYQRVIGGHELRHKQPGVVRIVKLYGCITEPESMVVTEEDHFTFLHRWPEPLDTLGRELSGKVFLFVGCDLRDRDFRHLYHSLAPSLGKESLAYAIQMDIPEPLAKYWATRGLRVIEADAAEFLERLAESIPAETEEEVPSELVFEPLKLQWDKLTAVGCRRTGNEDSLGVCTPSVPRLRAQRGSLFIVADGMGGHNAGEKASRLAVDTIIEEYYADASPPRPALSGVEGLGGTEGGRIPASLTRAIEAANRVIYQQARENPAQAGMGTTVVAAAVRGQELHIANVGDSRAYLVRGERIKQLTLDDTWVAKQVKIGGMTPEQAKTHPDRGLLTQALGDPEVEVHLFQRRLREGDIILLCSDGLFEPGEGEYVEDYEIKEVVSKHSPREAVKRLVRLANNRGGEDNISVIVIRASRESLLQRAMSRLGLR